MFTKTFYKVLSASTLSAAIGLGVFALPPAFAASAGHHGHHGHHGHAATPISETDVAYLLIAPDRGFLGNVEIQDQFDAFLKGRSGQIVYTTDERTRDSLKRSVRALVKDGAKRVIVLPFFVSESSPGYVRAMEILGHGGSFEGASITWAKPFGETYFAVAALTDRFRQISEPKGRRVVLVGHGAVDDASRKAMEADLQRIADQAGEGFEFESVKIVMAVGRHPLKPALEAALKGAKAPVVVPFHLGRKLDGMMNFEASLSGSLPKGVEVVSGEIAQHAAVPYWLGREANTAAPLRPEEVGVILLAHGSNHHWNETMIESVEPLTKRYMIEPALSMADPVVVERAVRRLEKRGAKGIVIVRVFGLSHSFKSDVEQMIGMDIEGAAAHAGHGAYGHGGHGGHGHGGHGHGHGDHGGAAGVQRILSSAKMTTLGGLDAHPLFGQALLDRANELSQDPKKETIVLVAHGTDSDERNAEWEENLQSLVKTMREAGGSKFREIKAATWREDWPDKREPSIARIRQYVADAGKNGGRVLVIPARTTARGPEKQLLEGLAFEHGHGFAPHPKFVQWFEEQIKAGTAALNQSGASEAHHHHH